MPFILPDKADVFIHYHKLKPCQWGEFVDKNTKERFTSQNPIKLRKYCKHTNKRLPLGPATHLTYSLSSCFPPKLERKPIK